MISSDSLNIDFSGISKYINEMADVLSRPEDSYSVPPVSRRPDFLLNMYCPKLITKFEELFDNAVENEANYQDLKDKWLTPLGPFSETAKSDVLKVMNQFDEVYKNLEEKDPRKWAQTSVRVEAAKLRCLLNGCPRHLTDTISKENYMKFFEKEDSEIEEIGKKYIEKIKANQSESKPKESKIPSSAVRSARNRFYYTPPKPTSDSTT